MSTQIAIDRPNELVRSMRRLVHQGMTDFVLHYVHGIAARAVCLGSPAQSRTDGKLREILEDLRTNHYHIVTDPEIKRLADESFRPVMSRLDAVSNEVDPRDRPIQYVTKAGYFGIQAALGNQIQLPDFTEEERAGIGRFLETSGLGSVLRAFYGAHYGVCNIRSWRYMSPKAQTPGNINAHFDGLAPNTLKMMYFRGPIDENSGCLELMDRTDAVFAKTIGESPLILFNSNWIKHQTTAPRTRPRDTIEITLMPSLSSAPKVVAAGFQAGYPMNPFRKWDRPIRFIMGL